MGFEELDPIFGEAKAEWLAPDSPPLRPFLFHMHALGDSTLRIHATDFHSNTWEAVRSIEQLQDMRDMIGIGGSWSEFIEYVVASLRSDDVKLILDGQPRRDGADYAKLIAQRSKGMPLISIPLVKLVDASARDAMANMSLELYKAFKSMRNLLGKGQERICQLGKLMSAEQEKIETIPQRQKTQTMGDKANSVAPSVTGLQDSPDKPIAQNLGSSKVAKRVVPTYRRTKKRGALLQDTEDDGDR